MMDHDVAFHTWNVFRRRHDDVMCCAVSAEVPLPAFLLSGEWNFGFAFSQGDPPVAGLSVPNAEVGIGLNGFHLFLAFTPPHGVTRDRAPPGERRGASEVGETGQPQGPGICPADEVGWIRGDVVPLSISNGRPPLFGAAVGRSIDP